ncbi:MAG: ADP-forming succinate--CoA ligase subunit beta [Gammaproteobacteria bacterium]|nr:ADP-forming succinate--CoA ligase subunit beta [Gammaproteobacteria bacterium]MXX95088.1 ADP-forming succinate--CoA ligase subunit beta [Gammaproteobacteria bacterium]MYF52218.1 ADP-forming succinate--CoA ligase subunit beta [Gammaproteobacteria bacterium]MYK42967.1 ADP-forming succinate--CoA ligase subunit beta [Gammaproteobacteria bacterium]
MNLHEYQAKSLFAEYGLPVSTGQAAQTSEEAVATAQKLGGTRWVAKVQVHAGGRGKAGGVKLIDSLDDLRSFANRWLGNRLVSSQTDSLGQLVSCIYVESVTDIEQEFYLGVVIDRSSRRVIVMSSGEGGVDIESVAAATPEKILRCSIDPFLGAQAYQARTMAFQLGVHGKQVKQFIRIFMNLCELFHKLDCSLVEINPLVLTSSGDLLCLDAKVNIDSNALFRHPRLEYMADPTQLDEREVQAAKFNLSYVSLDGDIGCMVNGAGLAMGTMDLVKLYGGNPANFLDVGGGVQKESVAEAFKILLSDEKVKTVLINIFGGIVSCEIIAKGIVEAYRGVGVQIPVVVRFDGNSAREGREVFRHSGLNIVAANSLQEAAQLAVSAAKGEV